MQSFLASRVDAARVLMRFAARRGEASGRLFVAKRCHEAAKAGLDVATALDGILAEVLDGLSQPAHDGARMEAELIRRHVTGAAK